MIKLGVRNFRSFKDLKSLEVRPLTIFVGRNSCGKSSITRLIPLLQQSFEQRTSSPILWTGNQVDFGSISDVLPNWSEEKVISIEFEFESSSMDRYFGPSAENGFRVKLNKDPIIYRAFLEESGDFTRLCGFDLQINGDDIVFRVDKNGLVDNFTINGRQYKSSSANYKIAYDKSTLFPQIFFINPKNAVRNEPESLYTRRIQILKYFTHGKTSEEKIFSIDKDIPYTDKSNFFKNLENNRFGSDFFRSKLDEYRRSQNIFEEIRISVLFTMLGRIVAALGTTVRDLFLTSVYVGPIRASGERYYRWRELAVDRIDPKGENLAMYLASLTENEIGRLSQLLSDGFGYRVRKLRSGGHVSIQIGRTGHDEWFNIADMGHGFSQLLPIVAQIHAVLVGKGRRIISGARVQLGVQRARAERLIAIEQPELHLHPALQGRLANLFENSIYSPSIGENEPRALTGLHFVLETHSESLLNAVGELVAGGRIEPNDVAIYVFEKPDGEKETTVTRSSFDKNGELSGWPAGFFIYEIK